ncbi:MAG TPA: amidohydrolase [Thermoanaerobaculia bacterium]|nr:amidohydrolase [Thermoanaerobaculia bacterium]
MNSRPRARRRAARAVLVLVAAVALAAACGRPEPASRSPEPAELVLRHGRIVTLDPMQPEAEALAARNGRIVAVGAAEDLDAYVGPETRVVELDGRLAVPGFIETHAHFSGLGESRRILDLTHQQSWDEVIETVASAAAEAEPGEWILGRGWHQEKWREPVSPAVEGFPVHAALSRVTPRNPVVLTHASGHAVLANARALELAGIDAGTPAPPGGDILRDASGRPTGLLQDAAEELLETAYERDLDTLHSARREELAREALELASREAISKGVTTLHDAGAAYDDLDRMAELIDQGRIEVRLWVMIRDSLDNHRAHIARARGIGSHDGRLTVRALKVTMDGALGTRTAWLLEPYSDLPGSTGLTVTDPAEVRELAHLAIAADYQLCVHAIGDRANRETLDIYEEAFREHPEKTDLRWRIEHAQHLHPDDIPRFGALGVVAAMQGVHCTSDAPWVVPRLGEQRAAEGAYVWRSLVDSGATVVNGTDAPVEDVDPIASFYATVTRRLADGSTFHPEQALTRMEALESYTSKAAWAGFEEDVKGTLEVGKYADVAVLSKDILTVPEEEIRSARVDYTIVGGAVVYERTP